MKQFLFKDETYQIIGCCMEVYNQLGGGFSEVIYKDALQIEFKARNIIFNREIPYRVTYKDHVLPHYYVSDFVAFSEVIIEAKAAVSICDAHIAQTLNYLKVSGCKVGLLINFGKEKLEYQRLIL